MINKVNKVLGKQKMFVVYNEDNYRQGAFHHSEDGLRRANSYMRELNSQKREENRQVFRIEEK